MGALMNMPAGEFKAKCLKLMDQVRETCEPIVITKYGKPVAQLIPVKKREEAARPLFGFLKDSVIVRGDIVGPTGERWSPRMAPSSATPGSVF